VNLKEIRDLIDLMRNTDLVELEVERAGVRIRVRKDARPSPVVPVDTPGARSESMRDASASLQPAASAPPSAEVADAFVVTSPIVGTFYRAPAPDAEPYVDVGDRVKKGQILCIVEAMKLMNEIESEVDGKIDEILIENAHPVEFGEPLFRITPVTGESA
jgi:acetyl-CoA carboxylase biotin carboxyl carrier protein